MEGAAADRGAAGRAQLDAVGGDDVLDRVGALERLGVDP
jgi:hypothetical protein